MEPQSASPAASAELERLLGRFPKQRPVLPPEHQRIYAAQYQENRSGDTRAASLAQRVEQWMHRKVAADVAADPGKATLELGAGTLNQLPFEPATAPYDIVEPFHALFEDRPGCARLRAAYDDVADIPQDVRYDRVTSVAVLEHICDLPFALARAARLLKPGGVLRAAIPSEGGFLWTLGWRLTTGLEYRLRHGLDYGVMMRHEHVNTAAEIEGVVAALFEDVRVEAFGVGRQLSLYRFIEARRPRLDRAAAWEARFSPPASG